MKLVLRFVLLTACLMNVVKADPFNGNCTGLVIINNSEDVQEYCEILTNATYGIKLSDDCSPPKNGSCDAGKVFDATAPIDIKTNLPIQCCSLDTNTSGFILADYVTRYTTFDNTPYCPIRSGLVTALRSVATVSSLYANGTTSSLTIYQCQGVIARQGQMIPNEVDSCLNESFVASLGIYPDMCRGDSNLAPVPDDQCVVVNPDDVGNAVCPMDTWFKGIVTVQPSSNEQIEFCCKSGFSHHSGFAKRTAEVYKVIDTTSSVEVYCDNGTFAIGTLFNQTTNQDMFVCAGYEYVPSDPIANSTTLTVSNTPTSVPFHYGHGNTQTSYGQKGKSYGSGYGKLNSVVDPYSNKAEVVSSNVAFYAVFAIFICFKLSY